MYEVNEYLLRIFNRQFSVLSSILWRSQAFVEGLSVQIDKNVLKSAVPFCVSEFNSPVLYPQTLSFVYTQKTWLWTCKGSKK